MLRAYAETAWIAGFRVMVQVLWLFVLWLIAFEVVCTLLGVSVGINPTSSQPHRVFLIFKGESFGRGDLVAFHYPGSHYYPKDTLFVKEAKGMPGDTLEIRDDRTVKLNGIVLDTVRATDNRGRRIKPFLYNGVIPGGFYFFYSSAKNSYDSRYYGLISKERIIGKVDPLF